MGWKTLKPFTQITQRGRNNRRGGSQSENTLSLKTYLATALHIRPPRCLLAFQQWQHCQKTQKQAVRYHCCSHGNGPAEGAPAPTLISTNSVQACSPAHTGRGKGGPPGGALPSVWAIRRTRLWEVPQGEKDQDSRDDGPAVLIRTPPLLNKDHTFPWTSSKVAGAAEERLARQ